MHTFPDTLVNAVSMATSITSSVQGMQNYHFIYIQAVFTGSPVGTFTIQSSNDQTNWDTISGSSVAISAAGSQSWNICNIGYPYLRVVYTRTSGSGSLTVTGFGKDY